MSAGDQINRVRKYIGQLKDESKIHHALSRLDRIDMTVDLLTETSVGKEVNRLRHHEQYGAKAQKIVDKWRKVVTPEDPPVPTAALKRPISEVEEITSDSRISFADALKASAPTQPVVKKIKITYAAPPSESSSAAGSSTLPASVCGQAGGSSSNNSMANPESDDMFTILRKGKPMKVYAGRKQVKTVKKVERLYDLAMTVCVQNVNMFTHGPLNTVPAVFKPVLQRCDADQLERIEYWNPTWEEDTDEYWKIICLRRFPKAKPDFEESWKECFKRSITEQEERLARISRNIKRDHRAEVMSTKKLEDTVIAPRNIQRRQANYGTSVAGRQPSAIEVSQARREIYRTGNRSAVTSLPSAIVRGPALNAPNWPPPPRSGGSGASSSTSSAGSGQRRGALMAKTLKMMKNRRR